MRSREDQCFGTFSYDRERKNEMGYGDMEEGKRRLFQEKTRLGGAGVWRRKEHGEIRGRGGRSLK